MLADKLSSLRKSRGLTQAELAAQIFVSRSMIAKYETGKAYPTNEILQKLANYFEVSVEEFVQREELIDEHSKTLEDNLTKKRRLVTAVAIIGIVILCVVAVLSVIEMDTTEYVVDYAQMEWDADFAAWNLTYYEESNPDIWQRRARLHLNEFFNHEGSGRKVQFTIEGEDWYVQYNQYPISEDYRELQTATLYYRVTVRKNLLGIVQGKECDLERVDFHLQ